MIVVVEVGPKRFKLSVPRNSCVNEVNIVSIYQIVVDYFSTGSIICEYPNGVLIAPLSRYSSRSRKRCSVGRRSSRNGVR
jgi:hypothetical protein